MPTTTEKYIAQAPAQAFAGIHQVWSENVNIPERTIECDIVVVSGFWAVQISVDDGAGNTGIQQWVLVNFPSDRIISIVDYLNNPSNINYAFVTAEGLPDTVPYFAEVYASWQANTWFAKKRFIELATDGTLLEIGGAQVNQTFLQDMNAIRIALVTNDNVALTVWEQLYVSVPGISGTPWNSAPPAGAAPIQIGATPQLMASNTALTRAVETLANTSVDVSFNNGATVFSVLGGSRTES